MRSRIRALAGVVLIAISVLLFVPVARAGGGPAILAQETESENQDTNPDEGAGASEGESAGTVEETGPPWTYQMARISLLLLLVMAVGIGFSYYRLIVRRQRGA